MLKTERQSSSGAQHSNRKMLFMVSLMMLGAIIATGIALWLMKGTKPQKPQMHDLTSLPRTSAEIDACLTTLLNGDITQSTLALGKIRMAASRLTYSQACILVDWFCSEQFRPQMHEAAFMQISFYGRHAMEIALIEKILSDGNTPCALSAKDALRAANSIYLDRELDSVYLAERLQELRPN